MPRTAVTGASGQFGRLVVEALLRRGVPAADVVALVRTPAKVADLAERGVTVREADYARPETLAPALDGVDRLLLVSGTDFGQRTAQHRAVLTAAEAAGVQRLAYTSVSKADTSRNPVAPEHRETEELLAASPLATTVLRNPWYVENHAGQVEQYVAVGGVDSAAGDGRISGATRADLAEAAAVVLTEDGHEGRTYELGGASYSLADVAAAVTAVTGTRVAHRPTTADGLRAALTGAGLDEGTVGFLVAVDESTAAGDMEAGGDDLARLVGRAPETFEEFLRRTRA